MTQSLSFPKQRLGKGGMAPDKETRNKQAVFTRFLANEIPPVLNNMRKAGNEIVSVKIYFESSRVCSVQVPTSYITRPISCVPMTHITRPHLPRFSSPYFMFQTMWPYFPVPTPPSYFKRQRGLGEKSHNDKTKAKNPFFICLTQSFFLLSPYKLI